MMELPRIALVLYIFNNNYLKENLCNYLACHYRCQECTGVYDNCSSCATNSNRDITPTCDCMDSFY